jgi:hypothetical protein
MVQICSPRVPTSAESASGSSPLVRNIKSSVSPGESSPPSPSPRHSRSSSVTSSIVELVTYLDQLTITPIGTELVNLDTVIIRDPTPFSGRPGENVRHYVKQCKYAWIGMSGMKEEERQEAQAMTSMSGLRGPALEFAHTLSQDIQDSFELFSQKLIDQFPFEKKVVNKFDVWMQACPQKQGNRSFEEYAESVRLLSSQVGSENQNQSWPKHGLRA